MMSEAAYVYSTEMVRETADLSSEPVGETIFLQGNIRRISFITKPERIERGYRKIRLEPRRCHAFGIQIYI